jgi:hypothetical protein
LKERQPKELQVLSKGQPLSGGSFLLSDDPGGVRLSAKLFVKSLVKSF